MQSCELFDPGFSVMVVPGQEKHTRLSLRGWKERRSHKVHGASPVGENDPGAHGTMDNKLLKSVNDVCYSDDFFFARFGLEWFPVVCENNILKPIVSNANGYTCRYCTDIYNYENLRAAKKKALDKNSTLLAWGSSRMTQPIIATAAGGLPRRCSIMKRQEMLDFLGFIGWQSIVITGHPQHMCQLTLTICQYQWRYTFWAKEDKAMSVAWAISVHLIQN